MSTTHEQAGDFWEGDRIPSDYDEPQREHEGDWDGHESEDLTYEPSIDPEPPILESIWREQPLRDYPLSEAGKAYEERKIKEASEK